MLIDNSYSLSKRFDSFVSVSKIMANPDRTLKELATPDMTYQPLGITYP